MGLRLAQEKIEVRTVKAVFIYAWGGPQYASTIKPILEEMQRRGHEVKWGDFKEKTDVFVYVNSPDEIDRKKSVRKHDFWHPHGLGEEILGENHVKILDYMLCRGPLFYNNYMKNYPQWRNKFKLVGYPKNDLMWKKEGKEKASRLAEELKLSRPTVTFTGTYGFAFSSLKEWMWREEAAFKALSELEGVSLVFKPHIQSVAVGVKLNLFQHLMEKYPKVKWIDPRYSGNPSPHLKMLDVLPDGDITPLLMVTDILVADDFSSVLNEFLPLDRPFVKLSGVGRVCPVGLMCNVENLSGQVQRALANPKEFSMERKKWLDQVMYKPDGHASERAVKVIEGIVG